MDLEDRQFPDDHILAIGIRTAAVLGVCALAVASVGPSSWLPKPLYSTNLEHFAAFYLLALAFAAARYRTSLTVILRDTGVLATALEAARWLLPGPRQGNFDHWMADLGGVLATGAPLFVAAFRRKFRYGAP